MRENRMKRLLREGKAAVGSVISLPDLFVAEIMAGMGFDFLLIDTEHTPFTITELQNVLIALRPTDSTIIVRAAWNDLVMVKQILDVGAEGVIIPWVNTPAEAKRAVAAARYPPVGVRGYGPRRASRLIANPADYVRRANDEVLVIGQIETTTAIENLDGILTTPGLDAIMIGPADLAASLGHIQDLMNPAVDAAIGRVLAKCKEHRVPFGMFTGTLERARQWVSQGGQIATVGGDVPFLLAAATQGKKDIDALKAEFGG
jgi:2-keto-3-deoxy-L-rhamnonate aldolase RhmA